MPIEGVVSIDQNTQLLSARNLATDLTDLATASVLTQAHALVLLRQADATGLPDLNGLTTVLVHQQGAMREHATYYLDRLLPDTIKLFSGAGGASNLFTAARSVLLPMMSLLDSGPASRGQAEQVAEQLASNLDKWLDDAKDAANELDREASAVDRAKASLEQAVQAAIEALDGPNGMIAKANDEITTLRQAIEVDLQNVVMSGKDIGDGVKSLVTGILTTIGLGKDNEKDKEKDNQKDGTSGGSSTKPDSAKPAEAKAKANDKSSGQKDSKKPAASQAQDSASEESSFPVESIDAVSDGVSKMSQAMQQFTADNAKLADLYQQVSQMSAVLAVARAVGDQVASYAASLRETATGAATLVRAIAAVQSGTQQFADAVGDPAVQVTTLVAALNVGNSSWSRLDAAVLPIRQTLAGAGTLIPPRPAEVTAVPAR